MKRNIPALWGADSQVPFFTCYSVIGRVVCYSVVFTLFIILVFSYFSLVLLFPLSIWLYRQREEHLIKGLYSKANSP